MKNIQIVFIEFVNNVHCRYESNQHLAEKCWDEIKEFLPDKLKLEFRLDWIHYKLNQLTMEQFGKSITELKNFFITVKTD